MSRDVDARGRQAAASLKAVVTAAELTSVPPGTPIRRRPLAVVLRPALIAVLLIIGSTVGVALVTDSTPSPPPAPVVTTTTTTTTTTTVATTVTTNSAPPTTAYVAPVAPTTTVAADLEPPLLEITYPAEGAELDEKTVTFAGTTEPGARVFAGRYEADVDSTGHWEIILVLNEGSNVARFLARDPAGNESEASVTVYYVVAESTTTTTEKELAEFTAYATFGSCSETPPYDVYYGTGEPGSIVEITSEYGSGSVEVGTEGHWEIKVIFETAPPDKPFLVRATDSYGRKAEFEFVYNP